MEHLIKWLKENGHYENYKMALRLPVNQENIKGYTATSSCCLDGILSVTLSWITTKDLTGIYWGSISKDFDRYLRENNIEGRVLVSEIKALAKESPYAKMLKFARKSHGTPNKMA